MHVRAPRTYTADELLRLPDEKEYELDDGRLIERHSGAMHAYVAANIAFHLVSWTSRNQGYVFSSSCGYQCFPGKPNRVIRPDISLIRRGRLCEEVFPAGWITIPPDLVVEIVGHEECQNITSRISEYQSVGVPLIWTVDLQSQTVCCYHREQKVETYIASQTFRDDAVLSGFSCRVAEFFGLAS